MRIMGTNQKTNFADSSNMGPLFSGFGFHFCRQSFDGYGLYGFPFFHERIASRTPIFAFHKIFPPLASIGQSAFTVFPTIVSLPTLTGRRCARSPLPTTNAKNV
jgi:hypothetical protein